MSETTAAPYDAADRDIAAEMLRLRDECHRVTERIAELVSEGNELRGLVAKVDEALLEGGQDHASKARKAIKLIAQSGLLHRAYEDAAATAGTGHLAAQLHRLAIPDEDTEDSDLRAQLAAVAANRDAWCERAGELLTETRKG